MAESSELSPVIYPKIVNSIPFKLELMIVTPKRINQSTNQANQKTIFG